MIKSCLFYYYHTGTCCQYQGKGSRGVSPNFNKMDTTLKSSYSGRTDPFLVTR